ncbi:hypothetical protein NDU88_003353 [Pleurodeles waltl]|uniref:Uncharacterized protein n=1 Tax=Pleurodeles waltl TaxID=8319 RepID=A0AAV7TNA7_PLEWA|nr:hypothetical protein NDU88_003353 [Pleurodeles waltl]
MSDERREPLCAICHREPGRPGSLETGRRGDCVPWRLKHRMTGSPGDREPGDQQAWSQRASVSEKIFGARVPRKA